MSKINWQGLPPEAFRWRIGGLDRKDDIDRNCPIGEGVIERFLGDMFVQISDDYEKLMSDEEWHGYEEADEAQANAAERKGQATKTSLKWTAYLQSYHMYLTASV